MMRWPAERAGQAGQTAMQNVSCPRRKRIRTDRLRRCVGPLEMLLEACVQHSPVTLSIKLHVCSD
jgi:hypothetical protein